VPVDGQGSVYAATVVHRPTQPSFAKLAPYAYALVDLDEGIRVSTIVIGCPPDIVAAGMRVQAEIDLPSDEDQPATPLILFTPVGSTSRTTPRSSRVRSTRCAHPAANPQNGES